MTLWYDVSDLTNWSLPHLTGIQRTTVGILDGLVGIGAAPRLVAWNADIGGFAPLEAIALPETIRRHLPWAAGSMAALETGSADCGPPAAHDSEATIQATAESWPPAPRRRRVRDAIFGTSPDAADLRTTFREFKVAGRQFRRQLARWSQVRVREALGRDAGRPPEPPTPAGSAPPSAAFVATAQEPGPRATARGPFRSGDMLVSVGASWAIAAHAEATAALRPRGVRVVRMIYDLIPTLRPQWVDETATRILTDWVQRVLTDSDHVLTISEFSRREIDRYCAAAGLVAPPLSVVRLGDVLPACSGDPPPPRTVPERPFFLCVSNLDIRKNHRLLYDTWSVLAARSPDRCPDLVCVGLPNPYTGDLVRELTRDPSLRDRIHLRHGVDDAELAWYYRSCVATIYASRYEGWGLPVAESLGHGRLCLASSATSIPEISPDLPVYFDPYDQPGLVALVERSLGDPEWVRDREAEIRRRFAPTPWTHTASQVLAAATGASEPSDSRAA
ncbi:MAG: glycosyltransferase family 1 protein [Pirellulales bacterium]